MPKPPENYRDMQSLINIVKVLRGPEGCPWDKEQTHASLARYAIEESHELAEAIDSGDRAHLVEELGDVLFQVILHSELGRQSGEFTLEDVIERVSEKMVRRHPHVFADAEVADADHVVENWEAIKAKEKAQKQKSATAFDIPQSMAATLRSHKIGSKTRKVGFDWDSPQAVYEKIQEEMSELESALSAGDKSELEHEIGDVLFTTVQLARHLDLDGEQCLRKTNQRFEKRYFNMLKLMESENTNLAELNDSEKEAYWQRSKKQLK